MIRRRSRRRIKEAPELNITTFLNLMVVLIPFLLISAVFSQVTILELSVPTAASTEAAVNKREFSIEVIVREAKLEFSNGSKVVATIPKMDGEYDLNLADFRPCIRNMATKITNISVRDIRFRFSFHPNTSFILA